MLLGVVFAALIAFWVRRGSLKGRVAVDLVAAVACVLVGLGFTVHSWLPGACVGWRLLLPTHG